MSIRECSECGCKSHIFDTRVNDYDELYRLRQCPHCGQTWKTFEVTEEDYKRIGSMAKLGRLEKAAKTFVNSVSKDLEEHHGPMY